MNKVLITGQTEDEIWRKIADDLSQNEPLDYQVFIESQGRQISLNIDIDLGGGFEGGYAVTSFSSLLHKNEDFRFAIHREDFIDEIGKFFGMQDVVIGYAEFDNKVVIKTNDEARAKFIFSDPKSRQVFQSLDNFSFGVAHHHVADSEYKEPFLELIIEDGITDVTELRQIYVAFFEVLMKIDPMN